MRFNNSRKISSYKTWEPWYAWFPISIDGQTVIFETVERKWDGSCYEPGFIYRHKETNHD